MHSTVGIPCLQAGEDVNGEISNTLREQATGFAQINQAVGQLDSVTQQNAAMVEQLAAAAGSLHTQSSMMHDSVQIFRLQDARDSPPSGPSGRSEWIDKSGVAVSPP
jgi:aerotaxis receptor